MLIVKLELFNFFFKSAVPAGEMLDLRAEMRILAVKTFDRIYRIYTDISLLLCSFVVNSFSDTDLHRFTQLFIFFI